MPYRTKPKPSWVPWTILAAAIALLVVGGVWYYNRAQPKVAIETTSSASGIDYSPATKDQKNAAGTNGNKATSSVQTNQQDSSDQALNSAGATTQTKQTVNVTITTWAQKNGNITVNGYADVAENDGTCTLILTQGNKSESNSHQSQFNATNTTCGEVSIPVSSLGSGSWQAILNYGSPTSTGSSKPIPIEIN